MGKGEVSGSTKGDTGGIISYVSSNGLKMRINHTGTKTLEEALLEYLSKQ